nr:MAG TPA: protein of unknown function (DUF5338) [Caudoviricetes sp.]
MRTFFHSFPNLTIDFSSEISYNTFTRYII